ncbi:hypothetical protein D0394_12370 [Staphylococcus epidermidis]|nr:hypothetical protein [Staphylococcus epidermidis]
MLNKFSRHNSVFYSSFFISFTTFNIGMISNDKIKADSKIRKIFISLKNIKSITYPKKQSMIKRQIK